METSLTMVAVFTGIIALSNLIFLGGLAYLAVTLKRLLDKSVRPAIDETKAVVDEAKKTISNVNEMLDAVESKAKNIMDIGEETARSVSGKVIKTTDIVEESVTAQFINIASLFSGISKALDVWRGSSGKS